MTQDDPEAGLEPERYELREAAAYRFELLRRDFVKLLGGGIAVCLVIPALRAQESGSLRRSEGLPREVGTWLHIDEQGTVRVFVGKVEIGQNIRTSLSQVVAEELRTRVDSIRLVMGDTDLTPFDAGTFGSRTTPVMAAHLFKVAAAAREALLGLSAQQWGVTRETLLAHDGRIEHKDTKRSVSYGELAKGQNLLKVLAEGVPSTPPDNWTIAGQPIPKVDGRAIVTGRHRYTSDLTRPGMLRGKVLRPVSFGASLVSADISKAEAMPGITVVRDAGFVGVAASSELLASKALAQIRAEWKEAAEQPSSAELFDSLKNSASTGTPHETGSLEEGLSKAQKRHEATYTVAYIAHAPLEPRAALAEWSEGKLTVWTGTQRPFGVRAELAEVFHVPETSVRVIVPDTGSAYGGKHTGETAIEAARLAKAAGRAVKVVWTREEEFTWAYFRPAGVIEVRSGVGVDGVLSAWEFQNFNSGSAGIGTPYSVPNQRIVFHPARSPLRQGSYRGLAATANHFARETHMDELARIVSQDPLEFRLRNLKNARLKAVLEAASQRFGWERKASPPSGRGLACGVEKGGYVATCAEVAVSPSGAVQVQRAVTAFECGAILNPEHLTNQIEGSLVQAIGGALFEEIRFEAGKILNGRFSRYRVPRFADVPSIEVVLLDRKDLPSAGAGETPIVALAPAVGNATFEATGRRLRSLPLAPGKLQNRPG